MGKEDPAGASKERVLDPDSPAASHDPQCLSRREAVGMTLGGLSALIFTGERRLEALPRGRGSNSGYSPENEAALVADRSEGGDRFLVGAVSELLPDSGTTVNLDGLPVIVLNVEEEIRAMSALCTHEGCPVTWDGEERVFQCPCHEGRFDASGEVISGPPPAALFKIGVEIEEGLIYLLPPGSEGGTP